MNKWNCYKIIMLCFAVILLLSGCSFLNGEHEDRGQSSGFGNGSRDNDDDEPKSDWDCQDLQIAFEAIAVAYNSCGDWTPGENNISFFKRVDPEFAVFTIYVNPVATDEVMDDYVKLALAMDHVFDDNINYREYCEDNDPYFIEFNCHNEIICEMELNGKNDEDDIREMIENHMQSIREEVSAKLVEFNSFLESYDKIYTDEEGKYYFIVDSSNISKSVEEIAGYIDEINQYNPIGEDEYMYYNGSQRMMGVIDGEYTIYFDEYGSECLMIGFEPWRYAEIEFATGSKNLPYWFYDELVGTGTRDDIADGYSFYYLINTPNRDPKMQISLDYIPAGADNEDVCSAFYKIYDYVYEKHELYGIIPWCELNIYANYKDPSDDSYMYEISDKLSWEEHLTEAEFMEWYMEHCRRLPSNYYEEG